MIHVVRLSSWDTPVLFTSDTGQDACAFVTTLSPSETYVYKRGPADIVTQRAGPVWPRLPGLRISPQTTFLSFVSPDEKSPRRETFYGCERGDTKKRQKPRKASHRCVQRPSELWTRRLLTCVATNRGSSAGNRCLNTREPAHHVVIHKFWAVVPCPPTFACNSSESFLSSSWLYPRACLLTDLIPRARVSPTH